MRITRKRAVDLFIALGFPTADKWKNLLLQKKITKLRSTIPGIEDMKVADERINATIEKVLGAGSDIEVVDAFYGNKKKIKKKISKKKKKRAPYANKPLKEEKIGNASVTVIDYAISILLKKKVGHQELHTLLCKKFPHREPKSLQNTTYSLLSLLKKFSGLKCYKTDDNLYYLKRTRRKPK